ncbi:MAG: hypothetical protein O3A00_09035 [Planctomycetota bacterium]|nr:hypothetical protein [Planctomycetota bacterium]
MNVRLLCWFCASLCLASCAETDSDVGVVDQSESNRPGNSDADSHANHSGHVANGAHVEGNASSPTQPPHGNHADSTHNGAVNQHGGGHVTAEKSGSADKHKHSKHKPTHGHSPNEGPIAGAGHNDHGGHDAAKDNAKSKSHQPTSNHGKAGQSSHHQHAASNPHEAASEFVTTDDATIAKTIASAVDDELSNQEPTEIFTSRILPIAQAERSSSCTECHFSGVELRDFILNDQHKTFASLKAGGLIDVEQPDKSKLLRFIARKPTKTDALKDKVRQQELIAFRAWIHAAVKDPAMLKATSDVDLGTKVPPEVIRHARTDRVLSSFLDNIWSEMGRCISCHSPERNRNKIGRNGFTKDDVDAISWIVPRDPAGTLQKLVDSGNIDFDDPANSPVLTKPAGLSEHKGGPKFFPGSPTYRNFLAFLTDFAAISNHKYRKAADLPAAPKEMLLAGKQQLRIVRIPPEFSGKALQVNLFRRLGDTGKWSEHRWATVFSRVNGKQHVWQNPVLLAAPTGSKLADELRRLELLPAGSYLGKIYIDRDGKTEKDPTYELGESDYAGQFEISGEWKPGYQPPKIVGFPQLRD